MAGILSAWVEEDGVVLDFPQFRLMPAVIPSLLETALNMPVKEFYQTEQNWCVAITHSEENVINAAPDFPMLKQIGSGQIIISALCKREGIDYVNRCFVPALGINEDPVTGSAQCAIGPYWSGRLCKETLNVFQASARAGYLQVKPMGNRVFIKGRAVLVFKLVPPNK
jgi:PhzF family phenazine biosynthesis protein